MSLITTRRAILQKLRAMGSPRVAQSMARFGISTPDALGIPMPRLRKLAREIGSSHRLASELWKSGLHEARTLAALIDDPERVTEAQMERWAGEFDSWDVCDCCCGNLFDKTAFAYRKVAEWTRRREEYVKRAGFSLMAALAVHDKKTANNKFLRFLPLIKRESTDERNFVKKAVNWALRQIGKRNLELHRGAVETAFEIKKLDSRSARWIAADALRELRSAAVGRRLRRKKAGAG